MTNILYLKDSFDPRYGNRDEVQFATAAAKHGHKVNIATSNYNLNFEKDTKNLREFDKKYIEGYKLTRHAGFKIPFTKSIFFFTPFKIINKKEQNILFVHNLGSFSSFMIRFYNWFKKPKIIIKSDFGIHTYQHARKSWFYRKIILMPIRHSDCIICFTKKEKEYLVDLGIPSSKIKIVPIGIEFEKIPDLSEEPGSSKGQVIVGMAGRICEQKGHNTITEPMKKLLGQFPNSRFFVVGTEAEKDYLETFLGSFKGIKNFESKGFVDNIYEEFIKVCDIVIIPSKYETGSILCLEAMAAGKAIVASDITPHNDYIQSGTNGFLAKTDKDYYTICKKLLENPEEIMKVGKAARESAKKHDWVRISDDVENIYSNLL